MRTKCNIRQWKLANRHSTIIRNWCHNDSQAKINMEADISALNAIKWKKLLSIGPPPLTLRSRGIRVFPRGFTCLDGSPVERNSTEVMERNLVNGTQSARGGAAMHCTQTHRTY